MEPRDNHFAHLIEKFKSGDRGAFDALYAEYGGVVREAVRRRLPARLRKEYDSLDFVQDVWASLCQLPAGECSFATPEALGGFLVRVAYNKVIDVCRRRLGTQGFDVKREQPLMAVGAGLEVRVAVREATPSQWAIADEKWAAIVAALPTHHVAVMSRLREGYSQQEVAAMAGITDRTVRRIVERVREICEVET